MSSSFYAPAVLWLQIYRHLPPDGTLLPHNFESGKPVYFFGGVDKVVYRKPPYSLVEITTDELRVIAFLKPWVNASMDKVNS